VPMQSQLPTGQKPEERLSVLSLSLFSPLGLVEAFPAKV